MIADLTPTASSNPVARPITYPPSIADENGFRRGVGSMPDADYFAAPGVSQSSLKALAKSPAHYLAAKAEPMEATASMKFGTWFDWLMFDREQFDAKTCLKPADYDGRTKAGKEWMEANAGREGISADEWQRLCKMRQMLLNKRIEFETPEGSSIISLGDLLGHGKAQQCAFAPYDGLQRKGKIDFVPPMETGCLIDLKTTTDASPSGFRWAVSDYDYHVQAAYYLDLWKDATGEDRSSFLFIAVETESPFAVSVFNLSGKAIGRGRETYINRLAKLIECVRENSWPAYPDKLIEIDLPERDYRREAA